MWSLFQDSRNYLLKGKGNRELESVQLSLMEQVRILFEQKSFHEFFEKKADRALQGELTAQTRLSGAQADMDRREWERRNADIALYETGRQIESQEMELNQANQLSDEAQREKSRLCEELFLRNSAFQEDRARDCQEIEELRRLCCVEADRSRQLKLDELSRLRFGNCKTSLTQNNFMILKLRAAPDYSTFPVNP